MSWNNGGQSPWGNPGGSQGGGSSGGSGGGNRPPPGGPWGGGGDNEPPGGGRRPGGPFGGGGQGGNQFPDLDSLLAQLQALIRRVLGGGEGGGGGGWMISGRGIAVIALGVVAIWGGSSFYRVQPDEQGVVLRFGQYVYWTPPGLHWHLPWPIERVERPTVTRINRTEIGYRSVVSARDQGTRDVPVESLMLTGDENIIDIDIAVFWRINNAAAFLFNARTPELLVRGVSESSLREVIGRTPIQPALTQARAQIEADVLRQTQQILDRYKAGVEITQVQLQKVDPPAAVIESFRDVQRANTDAERMRNEAESFRNDIVPRARGEAARITTEAEGAKQAAIAQATGQTQRFDNVLAAYQKAKEVTVRRMYLDAMQDLLTHTQTLIVDDRMKGLVPFLPLNMPPSARPTQPTAPANPTAGTIR
jgi:membrane protease subunit HflK